MKKKTVESSIGVHVPEAVAKHIDTVLSTLPKEARYEYRRKGTVASNIEVVGQRSDISTITTSAMDRDFEIVRPEGIDLTQYDLNRIVLFGHDQNKPVGKALWVKPSENGLSAKTVYTNRPKDWQGEWLPDYVWAMVQAEVLRGRSIGFLPLEVIDPTPEELALNPTLRQVITKSLLLEFSVVSVPSNPLALVEAIGKGLVGRIEWTGKNVRDKRKADERKRQEKQLVNAINAIELNGPAIIEQAMKELLTRWEV